MSSSSLISIRFRLRHPHGANLQAEQRGREKTLYHFELIPRLVGSGAYGDRLTAVHMADATPGRHPTVPTSGFPTLPNHAVQKIKENIVCEPAACGGNFLWEAVRDAVEREV
jgi:hypothetical protein